MPATLLRCPCCFQSAHISMASPSPGAKKRGPAALASVAMLVAPASRTLMCEYFPPTILVVTATTDDEELIVRAQHRVSVGRQPPLPLLLTAKDLLDAAEEGAFGLS